MEVTREEVKALRDEAASVGDLSQVEICGLALAGDQYSLDLCEAAIAAASAMEGEENAKVDV